MSRSDDEYTDNYNARLAPWPEPHPDDEAVSSNLNLSYEQRRTLGVEQAAFWLESRGADSLFYKRSLIDANRSDEEWAALDRAEVERRARVAARQEQERLSSEESARWAAMIKGGFPLRALEVARAINAAAPAVLAVKAWDCDKDNILVLSGPAGCGKTVAATHWAYQRRRPWPRDCGTFLRATVFAASSRYDAERRESIMKSAALVLDDLGTEYEDTKGNFRVDLDELVDTYYGDRRPLVITTNLTAEMFKSRYGERVYDRLRECGSWLSLQSESMRRSILS